MDNPTFNNSKSKTQSFSIENLLSKPDKPFKSVPIPYFQTNSEFYQTKISETTISDEKLDSASSVDGDIMDNTSDVASEESGRKFKLYIFTIVLWEEINSLNKEK